MTINENAKDMIVCRDVQKWFDEFHVLRGITATVREGEVVVIVGPSGSGKSTFMNLLGCLDTPSAGDYFLAGENVAHMAKDALAVLRNRTLGFVFQGFNLLSRTSALENVELPLLYRGESRAARHRGAMAALDRVGLTAWAKHTPSELSGGQQQRVAIARCLAKSPQLIFADEPTSALDGENGQVVIRLLRRAAVEHGAAVICVTHDPRLEAWADRVIKMEDGYILSDEKRVPDPNPAPLAH